MMKRIVGEDVRLTCEAGAGLGSVKIDPGSIEQVIVNLVVNARDAMPRGGYLRLSTRDETLAEDDVRSHPHRAPGEYVCLSVSDSGTGMTPDVLARIYEPFFTTKAVGKGTGLGLSTVFGIVQQGRGIVRVRSELDRGTTFEILLPRVDERAERRVEADSLATPRGTETVLLVEDEEQVRTVAAGILRRHGYQVLDARNAGDALLLCETHRGAIDLLVTDVVMPHMSGPDLARRLVAIRPQMRVLCMSGYTDDAAVRHGVFEAELEFLQKPFTVTSLTNRVRGVLDKMDSRAMRVAKRLLETAPS